MGPCRDRQHVLEVGEHTARLEEVPDLPIQRAFSLVRQMVNGEARDDGVEPAKRGQRMIEIVAHDSHGWVGAESGAQLVEHVW
jgi:hypothetical protein